VYDKVAESTAGRGNYYEVDAGHHIAHQPAAAANTLSALQIVWTDRTSQSAAA